MQPKTARTTQILAALALSGWATAVQSAEYISAESPTAESTRLLKGPFAHAFRERPRRARTLMDGWKKSLEDSAPFWRDTKFGFDLRSFSFDRKNAGEDTREAWAVGGRLAYESGRFHGFGLRAALYSSTELSASGGDTGLLAPGQKDINVLGEANLSYQFDGTPLKGSTIRLYRQTLDVPYINKQDIRMLPTSHEGYTIGGQHNGVGYIAGHVTKIKVYDSDKFVHMSEAAGAEGTKKGVSVAGVRLPITPKLTIGVGDIYGWDTFNTLYTEASYQTTLAGLGTRFSAQFTHQQSVGDELVGDFETHHAAARVALGWRGAVLKLGGSITSDNAGIRAPWGGKPSYLSLMRLDFDRANEKALLVGLSYNSQRLARYGLSGYFNIAWGSDAEDPATGFGLPDRVEYNITLDWKPPRPPLEGLWVRARYAQLDIQGDGDTVRDVRIIVNYRIPFL